MFIIALLHNNDNSNKMKLPIIILKENIEINMPLKAPTCLPAANRVRYTYMSNVITSVKVRNCSFHDGATTKTFINTTLIRTYPLSNPYY